ncbi:hypothetical protein ABIC29_002591 [Agromyces sp. PvR057]
MSVDARARTRAIAGVVGGLVLAAAIVVTAVIAGGLA